MVYLYHKNLSYVHQNVMVKMVEQWTRKHKAVGSIPTWVKFWWLFFKFFFIHTFKKFNIHKVLVEACLKNFFIAVKLSPKRPHGAVPSQDLNPGPCYRPSYKLNCVWCTVELKVIGNLEWRIKFYSQKKQRHFFYTIEYPYPPTNSVYKKHKKILHQNIKNFGICHLAMATQ
jgi:hypothetical protein